MALTREQVRSLAALENEEADEFQKQIHAYGGQMARDWLQKDAEIRRLRAALEALDRRGGLGIEWHDMIRQALADLDADRGATASECKHSDVTDGNGCCLYCGELVGVEDGADAGSGADVEEGEN